MVNIDKLDAVLDHIRTHPEQHDQCCWMREDPNCGTAACFAGWAVTLAGWKMVVASRRSAMADTCVNEDGKKRVIAGLAREILGLDYGDSEVLFDAFNTVEDLELMAKDLANGESLAELWHEDDTGHYVRKDDEEV